MKKAESYTSIRSLLDDLVSKLKTYSTTYSLETVVLIEECYNALDEIDKGFSVSSIAFADHAYKAAVHDNASVTRAARLDKTLTEEYWGIRASIRAIAYILYHDQYLLSAKKRLENL